MVIVELLVFWCVVAVAAYLSVRLPLLMRRWKHSRTLEGRIEWKRIELEEVARYRAELKEKIRLARTPARAEIYRNYNRRAYWKETKLIGDLQALELEVEEKRNEEVTS